MAPLFLLLAFWCTESFPSEQALIHSAALLYTLWLAIPQKKNLFYFFQCSYYYNSLKGGFHFIYTTSLGYRIVAHNKSSYFPK